MTEGDLPSTVDITFPIYRYHPAEDMGPGAIGKVKLLDAPEAIRSTLRMIWKELGNDLEAIEDPMSGTNGLGLLRSDCPLTRPQVVPGGILDAAGQDVPILDYDGPENLNAWKEGALGVLGFFGCRYVHRYTFGNPKTLSLEAFRERLLEVRRGEKGLGGVPRKKIRAAESFLDLMSIEFGERRAKHFHKTYTIPNWVRGT